MHRSEPLTDRDQERHHHPYLKGKGKSGIIDNPSALTDEVLAFHEHMCNIPIPDDGECSWKTQILEHFKIDSDTEIRKYFLDHCFKHLADLGKEKNKRIYVGPGRDGSSEDKISVDCKFMSSTTKIAFNKTWVEQGYVKSSFASTNEDEWEMIEDQVELPWETRLEERAEKLVVIIHPGYGTCTRFWASSDRQCCFKLKPIRSFL